MPGFCFADGAVDSTYGFLKFVEDYPLVEIIQDKLKLPCRIDNDARVVALGEARYGKGKDYNRMLVLTLGTGLGVGFTIAGQLDQPLPYVHMAGHLKISDINILLINNNSGIKKNWTSSELSDLSSEVGDTGFEPVTLCL